MAKFTKGKLTVETDLATEAVSLRQQGFVEQKEDTKKKSSSKSTASDSDSKKESDSKSTSSKDSSKK